ncbi:MAG TPA: GAF domain-containing protein [Abditibacteriaceae bacterium]|jgi:hypothetical protein
MSFVTCQADSTRFKAVLEEEGIFEALSFINSKSVHRFTALYIFDAPALRNVCLVDKQDSTVRQSEPIEITDSYCLFVRDSGEKFITIDSLSDERVKEHPKRALIQSYCGLPLTNVDGATLGTVCHFNFDPIPYTDDELILLEMASPTIVDWIEKSLHIKGTIVCPCCQGTGSVPEDSIN